MGELSQYDHLNAEIGAETKCSMIDTNCNYTHKNDASRCMQRFADVVAPKSGSVSTYVMSSTRSEQ